MFSSNNGYSLADIAAATGNSNGNNNGWGGDGAWWIIILFLFVFCGWGNNGNGFGGGNGGAQSALTRGELCQDMNFADLETAVRGVNTGLCDGFYAMNTGMLNGFSGLQQSLQSGFAGVDNAVCTLGYQNQMGVNTITQAINAADVNATQNSNALATQIAQCCCDNRAQLCDLKYDLATDNCALQTSIANATRDMIDNQNANTRSILDFLVNDKISTLENENQALRLSASQQAQNNYLVSTLRPAPVPAFAVPAPYQFTSCGGCGCGNGFGGINY